MTAPRGYALPRTAGGSADLLKADINRAFEQVETEAQRWGRWRPVELGASTSRYVASAHDLVLVTPASGGTTVLLPDATDVARRWVMVRHAEAGTVTVSCAVTTQTVDGGASVSTTVDDTWLFYSTGRVWLGMRWQYATGGGGVSDGDKGDITVTGSGATWTIDPNTVTLAKMADVATARILGRVTAGTGDPEALTGTQATTLLDVFTSVLQGVVPASGGGTANFLRADGTWAAPGGSGLTHPQVMARVFFQC